MLQKIKLVSCLICCVLLAGLRAFADQGPERKDTDSIIVTAQKTEENVQKIPGSVSVFSDSVLMNANIRNPLELTRFTPNVYMKKSTSENMISIRGITPFDSSIYSPTAFYVDDVLLPLHYMHNIDFYDLERIEVLKGPQGTLYGGNSESGVINVITKKPGNEFVGRVSTEAGVYPSINDDPVFVKTGFSFSGPVKTDRLFLGAAGMVEDNEGFMANLANGDDQAGKMDRYNGRVSLRYTPTDSLEVNLTADAMDYEDRIAVYRFETGPFRTEPYTVRHQKTDWSNEDGNGQALKIKYSTHNLDFLSVTGRREYTNNNQQDYDCTADPIMNWGETVANYNDRIFTQEFRLSSSRDKKFSWLTGLYAFFEETDIARNNETMFSTDRTRIDNFGYAVFGRGTYTIRDRYHASIGLRYDIQNQEGVYSDFNSYTLSSVRLEKDQDFEELLPSFSIGINLTPGVYTYALVSKGYLAGGYNYALVVDDDSFCHDPEYVWNYEIGIKASLMENRLVSSVSLFYMDISDKQVYEQITGSNPGTKIDNAAEAHTRGAELEMTARPVRGLDISASLGLLWGEYDDWVKTEWNSTYTGFVRNDYSGKTLPNVPEYTYSLGVQYRFINGIFIRCDVNGVGEFYGDHANTVKEDEYALVNLKLGYETDRFDIYLWGKNVFDKHYHNIKYDWDGEELVQDGQPLNVGLAFNWRF